jgi:Domain of unknown function (DUF4340)
MNPKNTWMLVLLAGGMFAFIYFFERHIQPPAPVVTKVLPTLNASEVTSIEIDPRGQFTIRVERTNGVWRLTKPVDYPVQARPIEELLKALENLTPQSRISAAELQTNRDINGSYGFGPNETHISLQQADEELQLNLGYTTPPGDGIYAQVVAAPGVDIVSPALMALVPTNAGQWRDTSFVDLQNLTADQFTNLTVTSTNGKLVFQRDGLDKPWRQTGTSAFRANSEKINALLAGLQNLRVVQFATDGPVSRLDQFGLQTPLLELDFKQGTNQFLSLQFGKSPPNDPDLVYARTNSSSTIVLVPRADLAGWSGDPNQFRALHLFSLSADPADFPHVIEAYGANSNLEFIWRLETNGEITVSNADGQRYAADPAATQAFIINLAGMRVVPWGPGPGQSVLDAVADSDLPGLGLKPPAKSYILKSLPLGGTDRIIAQVDFGLPDTNSPGTIAARRGDLHENSVFAVSNNDVEQLPTNAIQLRYRRVWIFESTNVTEMTIRSNGHSDTWTHAKENLWIPASGITDNVSMSNIYLENLAVYLGILQADYWVGPGDPTPALGFSDKSLQISVSGKGPNGEIAKLSLTLGGPAPGPKGQPNGSVYASTRIDGTNWIFTLPADYVKNDIIKLVNSLQSPN